MQSYLQKIVKFPYPDYNHVLRFFLGPKKNHAMGNQPIRIYVRRGQTKKNNLNFSYFLGKGFFCSTKYSIAKNCSIRQTNKTSGIQNSKRRYLLVKNSFQIFLKEIRFEKDNTLKHWYSEQVRHTLFVHYIKCNIHST